MSEYTEGIVRARFPGSMREYPVRCPIAKPGDYVYRTGWSGAAKVVGCGREGYTGAVKPAALVRPEWTKDELNESYRRLEQRLQERGAGPEMEGLAALVDASGTLHGISPDLPRTEWHTDNLNAFRAAVQAGARVERVPGRDEYVARYGNQDIIITGQAFARLNPHQENTTMKTTYTCPKGLLENPVPDNDELIAQHQEAIEAIKARKREAKQAEKKARREQREREAARAESQRHIALAKYTLEAIATDEGADDGARIAAAVELARLA